MHLDNLSDKEIVKLELATGAPLKYEFDKGNFKKLNAYQDHTGNIK